MKTKFALTLYSVAIVSLVAMTGFVIWRLIIMPPCTQIGNLCVIEGWSVAGLAGAVLGVAATVLAVLGAVAVAAWWTSLNERVTDQVKKLYGEQKAEINTRVDQLVIEQEDKVARVNEQIKELHGKFAIAEDLFNTAHDTTMRQSFEIDQLRQVAQDVEDIMIDGLLTMGATSLDEWAQKVMQKKPRPDLPLKMANSYLDSVQLGLATAEQELKAKGQENLTRLQEIQQLLKQDHLSIDSSTETDKIVADPSLFTESFLIWQQFEEPKMILYWNRATYWADQGDPEFDPLTQEDVKKRLESYRPYIENLKKDYDQLKAEMGEIIYQPALISSAYQGLKRLIATKFKKIN